MQQQSRKRGRPKGTMATQPVANIQALDRALDVLEALAANEGITLTELSNYLDQSPATMHRVLATLEHRQYVESDTDRQTWYVGSQAFRLGSAFLQRTNLVERSRAVMRELMSQTGETSNLGIEKDGNVLFVSQIETHETIRAFFAPGTQAPLHASGIGKALLSAFDDLRLEAFIKTAQFDRFTENTLADAQQLREAVTQVRRRGYALDDEERTIGMRCVAAPIINGYGEAIAGISVSGPTMRMPDIKVHEIGKWVVKAAFDVSRQLGKP